MEYLSTSDMQTLERYAFENYPITLEQMMQNAGKAIFDVVMNEVLPNIQPTVSGDPHPHILVISGKGNNGGDALVTARLLKEKGIEVVVLEPYSDVGQSVGNFDNNFSLIIDALFGFSLKGDPKPPTDKLIEQINCSFFDCAQNDNSKPEKHIPVLSVDVPSGLDVHDGSIGNPTVKADYTLALGMLKKGFEEHPDLVGKTFLGDLGIPEDAYREQGYEPPIFRGKSYLFVN